MRSLSSLAPILLILLQEEEKNSPFLNARNYPAPITSAEFHPFHAFLHLIQKISRKRSISDINKISLFFLIIPLFPSQFLSDCCCSNHSDLKRLFQSSLNFFYILLPSKQDKKWHPEWDPGASRTPPGSPLPYPTPLRNLPLLPPPRPGP